MGKENPRPYYKLIGMNQEEWSQLLQKEFQQLIEASKKTEVAQTREEVQLIARLCQLKPNDAILDMACGQGRHLLEFKQEGFNNVIGMDASQDQLVPSPHFVHCNK